MQRTNCIEIILYTLHTICIHKILLTVDVNILMKKADIQYIVGFSVSLTSTCRQYLSDSLCVSPLFLLILVFVFVLWAARSETNVIGM